MRSLFSALVIILMSVAPVSGQDIKVVEWEAFASHVQFVDREFVHEGRPVHDSTFVNVPAGTFTSTISEFREEKEGIRFYRVTLFSSQPVEIEGQKAIVRVYYLCVLGDDADCYENLTQHIKKGFAMQSLGVPNSTLSGMPERPVLTFLANTTGRFRH